METKWTPGPWTLVKVYKWPFGIEIKAGERWIFSESAAAHSSVQKTRDDNEIGLGFTKDREQAANAVAEQDANAALVAAAPELYAALQLMVDACNKRRFDMEALYQANRAMLKARGEQ